MRRDETDRDMVPRENAAPGEKQPKEREDPDRNATYTQIAESLAAHYDLIYYIDCETSGYKELSPRKKSGELKIRREGTDFFAESAQNIDRMIHPEDRERLHSFLDRDFRAGEPQEADTGLPDVFGQRKNPVYPHDGYLRLRPQSFYHLHGEP